MSKVDVPASKARNSPWRRLGRVRLTALYEDIDSVPVDICSAFAKSRLPLQRILPGRYTPDWDLKPAGRVCELDAQLEEARTSRRTGAILQGNICAGIKIEQRNRRELA